MWSESNEMQAQGGGFLNESQAAAGTSDGKIDTKRGQNIVPVMIGHLTHSSDELEIWGLPVRIVTFMGIVRRIEQVTTKITYEIEDETDSIVIFNWLEADKGAYGPTIEVNTYVQVFGFLRAQDEKKHILVLRIRPIKNLCELTNHLLEVTYVMLKAEKMVTEVKANSSMSSTNVTMSDANFNGMTQQQAAVFKIIQAENDTECGIERDDIKARVPRNILPHVDEIIEFLACEGHIYTTRTDDHFKTT